MTVGNLLEQQDVGLPTYNIWWRKMSVWPWKMRRIPMHLHTSLKDYTDTCVMEILKARALVPDSDNMSLWKKKFEQRMERE
jgi:hypothetical protein